MTDKANGLKIVGQARLLVHVVTQLAEKRRPQGRL